MPRYIDADKLEPWLNREDHHTPDERWRPESELAAIIDSQPTIDVNMLTIEITLNEYNELRLTNAVLAEFVREAFAEDAGIAEKLQAAVRKVAAARQK